MGAPKRHRQRPCNRPPDIGQGSARALKGATLALICERPGHGYDLHNRLRHRLGPAWHITPKDLYPILDSLEKRGLIRAEERPSARGPRQRTVVYHPTELAQEALDRWRDSALRKNPFRSDPRARIETLARGDVDRALRILDDYEHALLGLLEEADSPPPEGQTWAVLLARIAHSGTDAHLTAELAWIDETRRRFLEYEPGTGN